MSLLRSPYSLVVLLSNDSTVNKRQDQLGLDHAHAIPKVALEQI